MIRVAGSLLYCSQIWAKWKITPMMSSVFSLLTHDPQIIFRQLCGDGNTSSVLHAADGRWGALAPWSESLDPEPSWTQWQGTLALQAHMFWSYLWISDLLLWHRPPTVPHPKAQQCMFHPEAADRSTRSLIEPVFVFNTAPCSCLTEKSSKTNQNHQTCSWDHRHQLSELLQRCSLRHTPTASESVWPKKAELTRTLLFLFLTSPCTRVLLIFTSVSCFHLMSFEPQPKVVICLHVIDNKASWILNPAQPKRKFKKQQCKPLLQAVFF